jgi:hypothetical protein
MAAGTLMETLRNKTGNGIEDGGDEEADDDGENDDEDKSMLMGG